MLIGVISDTHGLLRREAVVALRGSDRIIHAGDIGDPEILDRLSEIAPVTEAMAIIAERTLDSMVNAEAPVPGGCRQCKQDLSRNVILQSFRIDDSFVIVIDLVVLQFGIWRRNRRGPGGYAPMAVD